MERPLVHVSVDVSFLCARKNRIIEFNGGFGLFASSYRHDEYLQTDCALVVHLINGKTRKKKQRDLWSRLVAEANLDLRGVSARHVKGHTTLEGARFHVNRWCDREAKKHMREARVEMTNTTVLS